MKDELTTQELEKAYLAKVKELYNGYFSALLTAQGDSQAIGEAGKQFKKGLARAQQALNDTINLCKQLKP